MPARLSSRRPVVAALAAMVTLLPGATAQVTYEIAPYAGLYLPLGSMLLPRPPSQAINGRYGTVNSVAQSKTFALGAHVTAWLADRLGIEGTLAYAPSGVTWGCRALGCNDGRVISGSARVVVRLITVNNFVAFRVGGGVGLVDHGGRAYADVVGTTIVAPNVGAGVVVKVGASRLLRIDAEEYFFRPRLTWTGFCNASEGVCNAFGYPTIPGFQHDVIFSVGLAFRDL